MSGLTDVLEKLAPTLATLVGGPFAGTAVTALEGVFGLTPKADDSIAARQAAIQAAMVNATPEQILAMKQADAQTKAKLIDGGVQLEQISSTDRASARAMQTSTKSMVTPLLALLVLVGAVAGEGYAMTHAIPAGSEVVFGRILGTLDSALMLVLAFYFGSSSGSESSKDLISKAMDLSPPK